MSAPAARAETWVLEALQSLEKGNPEEALELVESCADGGADLTLEGYRELLRCRVLDHYRSRVPDSACLRRSMEPEKIMQFNLPASAGFLVTMLDGETAIGDVVALSGMETFEAHRILHRLIGAGIAEVVS
ncbi:MAG: hypothetical protein QNK05_19790 [Myxococcota bacterium]|nr:hypothetical protein [Myxococcota bacterium]